MDPPKKFLPRLFSYLPFPKRNAILSVAGLLPSEVGSLLDLGCGNGEFIARMRGFGWKVTGVDFDPAAVRYARSQGLDVHCGTITDLPEPALFDAIVLTHVIEHVADPVALLYECRKRLCPGGRVIISTPNIESLGHAWFKAYWRGLEVPRHFILFSPRGLRECVRRAGLAVCSMRTESRLAQMIYNHSACAQAGERNVGTRRGFRHSAKVAARLFRMIQNVMLCVNKNVGEEIFCVCTAALENPVQTVRASAARS